MSKVLMIASVASMIDQFNWNNIKILQSMGYEVDVACNFCKGNTCSDEQIERLKAKLTKKDVKFFQIEFTRSVSDIKRHILSYKQLMNIMRTGNYDFVHCHSPIGGVIGRLAAHKNHIKAIYTAHGFHFYQGAPLKNWVLFWPVEKYMSRFTDILITINREDYNRAKKFHAKEVAYVPGVGIDVEKFASSIDNEKKREELGLKVADIVLLSVGELSVRKNHITVLKALKTLKCPRIKYIICGQGEQEYLLKTKAEEWGILKQVIFLGFRNDILEICKSADIFVFPSLQEGLPVALMEAMAAGLPCVASEIRGNSDLLEDGKGGFLVEKNNDREFADRIAALLKDSELRRSMGEENLSSMSLYDVENIGKKMKCIYEKIAQM